jgi:hypothetical protein
MHQSPEKKLAKRRDKYADLDLTDSADRRLYRASQPKARKFAREESERGSRPDRGHSER